MQPTFDMLCLTCPYHHRNDQKCYLARLFRYKLLIAQTISNFWGVHWVHIRASEKYFNLRINGDLSPYTIGIFRQTNLSQEAIRLTTGDGGPR